jgi:hypothetical protein
MTDCLSENVLNIEIFTNTSASGLFECGCARYTITVFDSMGNAVCGAEVGGTTAHGGSRDFILPDGDYKISVHGDAYASPRMQQRWLTICGKEPHMHFGVSFVFDRVCTSVQPPMPVPPAPCSGPHMPAPCPPQHNCRRHPCAPTPSPFMPSMYVKEWEKRNRIEAYQSCGHSQTSSVHNRWGGDVYIKSEPTPPLSAKNSTPKKQAVNNSRCGNKNVKRNNNHR